MKYILIACDYRLKESVFGGMDEFYIAFDNYAKQYGVYVRWLFPKGSAIYLEKYSTLSICPNETDVFIDAITKTIDQLEVKPDLLVTHFVEFFHSKNRLWKQMGVSRIVVVDHMSRPMRGYSLTKIVKLNIKGLLYRDSIDGIVSVSLYVSKRLKMEYLSKLPNFPVNKVIYNGVNLIKYIKQEPSADRQGIRLVAVGNLIESKGFQLVIEALNILQKQDRLCDLSVDIIGDGPYRKNLEALIKKYNLGCIRMLGSLNNVNDLLNTYDVALQPSLWKENFPFTIIESFASGVPVIASRTGGLPELISEGSRGWLFKQGEAAQLANMINEVSQIGKYELDRYKQNCYEYAHSHLDLKQMVREHFDFYTQLK